MAWQLGRPLTFTPKHQFSVWANYIQHGLWRAWGWARYRGELWGLDYEIKVPDHVVADAALSYDFGVKNSDFEEVVLCVNVRDLVR